MARVSDVVLREQLGGLGMEMGGWMREEVIVVTCREG